MKGTYNFAGKAVQINSLFKDVHEYCSEYLCECSPDISVSVTQQDIEYERKKSIKNDIAEGRSIREWSDGYLEELAVYRKIAEKMPEYDTFLFHGSAVAVDGQCYLFTAKSGTGKSTHTRLWREYFGDRAVMVNDDKPLLHITDSGAAAYGTPYNGKHRIGNNISVPLKAICFLTRAANNHIEPITREQAYTMLLQQVYRPADSVKMIATLLLIDKLADTVNLYRLGCNMDISAARASFEGMR